MKSRIHAIITVIGLLAASCNDKATIPIVPPEPTEYNLYYGTWDYRYHDDGSWEYVHQIYVFDAADLSLRDSLPISSPAIRIEPSLDGRHLFLQRATFGHTLLGLDKIDASTGEVLWTRPYTDSLYRRANSGVYLLAEGNLVHYQSFLLDADDGHEVGFIPESLVVLGGQPAEPGGSEILVTVKGDPDHRIRLYNIETGAVHGNWSPRLATDSSVILGIYSATLHPDQRHVLAVGSSGIWWNAWFVFGDLETGETVGDFLIGNPNGEIAIDPKRNLAIITGPHAPTLDHPKFLYLADLDTGLPRQRLSASDYRIQTGQVCVNPFTGKLLTASGTSLGGGPLAMFDPVLLVTDTVVWPPGNPLAEDIAIAPRPQAPSAP
ncbi:MAG: hypothetical protein AB1752_12030 [Candidatus Zixiibacteriota bacterium]